MWRKDQKVLRNSKKYSISKKGALRIQDVGYSDSGMYTCLGEACFHVEILKNNNAYFYFSRALIC